MDSEHNPEPHLFGAEWVALLNVDYKIVTKVLAMRVKAVLPRIIHTDQTGFVSNRYLGTNVLDVQALMCILEKMEHQQEIALLS